MKLTDLDQIFFVPIIDETHDGASYEMQMTMGEFFDKFCEGFKPEIINAIPVEWLRKFCADDIAEDQRETIEWMLDVWQQEQEART